MTNRIQLSLVLIPLTLAAVTLQPTLQGDAFHYFSYVRSLVHDQDIRFGNEWELWSPSAQVMLLPARGSADPEQTAEPHVYPEPRSGYEGNMFTPGPALLWAPFYLAATAVPAAWLGWDEPLGFGLRHRLGAALGSVTFVLLGLLLCHRMIRRQSGGIAAWPAVMTLALASPLLAYYTTTPLHSHGISFFACAWVVQLSLDRRERLDPSAILLTGVILGLASLIRWQNCLLGVLPMGLWLERLRHREPRDRLGADLLAWMGALALFLLIVSPQWLAWLKMYGQVRPDNLRLLVPFRPAVLRILFSPNRGLFVWTPMMLPAALGLLVLARRDPWVGGSLLVFFLLQLYVNSVVADWWGGGGFAARRFSNCLPALGLGLGVVFEPAGDGAGRLRRWLRPAAWGGLVLSAVLALLLMNAHFALKGMPDMKSVHRQIRPSALVHSAANLDRLVERSVLVNTDGRSQREPRGGFQLRRALTVWLGLALAGLLAWAAFRPLVRRPWLLAGWLGLLAVVFDVLVLAGP